MEEPTKRPRVNPVVFQLMDLPPPARQQLLKNLTVIEIIFATKAFPLFSKWMDRTNQWHFVFETIVVPLIPPGVEVVSVGENSRWNCIAWYFAWHKITSIFVKNLIHNFNIYGTLVQNEQPNIEIYFAYNAELRLYTVNVHVGGIYSDLNPMVGYLEENVKLLRQSNRLVKKELSKTQAISILASIYYHCMARGWFVQVKYDHGHVTRIRSGMK